MKIEEILRKQGEIYKNLTRNKIIKKYNEAIRPESLKYKNFEISKEERIAIIELEKLLRKEPGIVNEPKFRFDFEISIENNQITHLRIVRQNLKEIPEQINSLANLKEIWLYNNKIKEIRNLNLKNLQGIRLYKNQIQEIKGLDKLTNLQILNLSSNKITKIKNLDNLINLRELYLHENQISEIKNIDKLTNLGQLSLSHNQIKKIKNLHKLTKLETFYFNYNQIKEINGLDKLTNLKWLEIKGNPIISKEKVKNLEENGVEVYI